MPITWDHYTRRRGFTTEEFVTKYNCKSYDDLCNLLNLDDILPPEKDDVQHIFDEQKRLRKKSSLRKPPQTTKTLGITAVSKAEPQAEETNEPAPKKQPSQSVTRKRVRSRARKRSTTKSVAKSEEKSE